MDLTRSAVANPSVKRLRVDASKSLARSRRSSDCHSSVRLIAVRNSRYRAPCRRAVSIDRNISASARSPSPPARREQPSCANAKKFRGTPAGAVGFAACENLIVRQCFVQGRKRLEQERSHDRTRRLDQRVPGIWLQSRLVSAPESMPDEKAVLLRAREKQSRHLGCDRKFAAPQRNRNNGMSENEAQ